MLRQDSSNLMMVSNQNIVTLPKEPLVSIRAERKWVPLDVKSLWGHRELLYFLTWRDVKVRYKQTLLGAAWVIIQPLLTMFIFTLFFGKLAGVPSDGIPYPVFTFTGLLPWTFFSNAVNHSGNSLVASTNLITKVYFPRLIIPTASIAASLVDFGIAFILLAILMIYYRITLTANILMLPVLVIITATLALGVGMLMSARNVKYRDIRHALPFGLQVMMFMTPIIYPSSMVPPQWRRLLNLNPLSGVIEAYRASLFGKPFNWQSLGYSAAFTLILLIVAAVYFRKTENTFADIV